MVERGWRKYPEDDKAPLQVTPMDMATVEEWHVRALELRADGLSYRQIAAEVGRSYTRVQAFLNPESGRRQKIRQTEREKELRHSDPEHAARSREYVRKYMQLGAKRKSEHARP